MVTPFIVYIFMDLMNSAVEQGIWSAIVVGIYLVIAKVIDTYKDIRKHNKEEEVKKHQIVINQKLVDSIATISDFITLTTKNIIDKDKERCINAIKHLFKSFANSIIKFSTDTIVANNIQINKQNILDNIEDIVNSEYYSLYNALILYHTDINPITDYIKVDWKNEIKDVLINIIYNENLNKEQKLYSINNKINIKINDYCIYVTNKYLEKC